MEIIIVIIAAVIVGSLIGFWLMRKLRNVSRPASPPRGDVIDRWRDHEE